jgi:hypothetical protein
LRCLGIQALGCIRRKLRKLDSDSSSVPLDLLGQRLLREPFAFVYKADEFSLMLKAANRRFATLAFSGR